MPRHPDRSLPEATVYDDATGTSVPWSEYLERHPSSPRPFNLGPGERINPFATPPLVPLKWRRPAASINPFGPPPHPWESGHYGFRFAYERARAIFEADDAIVAFADSNNPNPALVAPSLFAAAVSAAAHRLRGAIPPGDISAVSRAAALVAWHDTLADHAERSRHS